MNKATSRALPFGLVLLCLSIGFAAAQEIQPEPRQIVIKVAGATIHEDMSFESKVIAYAAVDSVYTVLRKEGEWYEVEVPSSFGMTITGYIHQRFLGIEEPAVKPQPIDTQVSEPVVPKRAIIEKKAYLSLSGLYHRQEGYAFELPYSYAGETATFYDLAGDTDMFGFRLAAGYFVHRRIEIALGLQYSRATLEGLIGMARPSDSLLGDLAYDDAAARRAISEIAIDIGVNFHILPEGPVRPYVGGGVCYIKGKIEMVQDLTVEDIYHPDRTHSIAIHDSEFGDESLSSIGFYGKLGAEISIAERIAIFGEGQYLYAKDEMSHPYGEAVLGRGDPVEIDWGGILVLLGAKIRF